MKDQTNENKVEQDEQPASVVNTENKKLRPGLKIRTRIKAGDDDYCPGNHGLKIRAAL